MKSRSVVDMSNEAVLALPCYNLASQYGVPAQSCACVLYNLLKTTLITRISQVDPDVATYYSNTVNPRLAKMKAIINAHHLWRSGVQAFRRKPVRLEKHIPTQNK
jgi:hypothetical protein